MLKFAVKALVLCAVLSFVAAEKADPAQIKPKIFPSHHFAPELVIVPRGDPRAYPPHMRPQQNGAAPAVVTPATPAVPTPAAPNTALPQKRILQAAAPSSAASCPVYANAAASSIAGNGNVKYSVVRIAAQHFTGSADNTMTKPTACAFARMAAAAQKAGIRLTINSGFRTLARQKYFYNCYTTKKCNNGNLAAKPGTSNHGRGVALDINTGAITTKTYKWMASNASKFGFRRTVPSEPWHWEFK
jgi:LAS superfamily LD-carboxypeptidase LdcB